MCQSTCLLVLFSRHVLRFCSFEHCRLWQTNALFIFHHCIFCFVELTTCKGQARVESTNSHRLTVMAIMQSALRPSASQGCRSRLSRKTLHCVSCAGQKQDPKAGRGGEQGRGRAITTFNKTKRQNRSPNLTQGISQGAETEQEHRARKKGRFKLSH